MSRRQKPNSLPSSANKSQRSTMTKLDPKPNLFIRIIAGKFKENIEEGGKDMDPYVKLKIGKMEVKTNVLYFALQSGAYERR